MNKVKKVVLSSEWSERIDAQRESMSRIKDIMRDWFQHTEDTERKLINDAVIKAADKMKCSIYDVCFNMAPRISYTNTYEDNKPTLHIELEFVPIEKSYGKPAKDEVSTLCWSREANALLNDGTMPQQDLFYVAAERLVMVEKDSSIVYSLPLADLQKLPRRDGYGEVAE